MPEVQYKTERRGGQIAVYSMPSNSDKWWLVAVFYAEAHYVRWLSQPDLLAACRALLDTGSGGDDPRFFDDWDRAVSLAERAIAKAEGKS